MKQYRYLLLDLDQTILDFKKTEELSLIDTFGRYGIVLNEQDIARYSKINQECWGLLEKKEIDKEQLKALRFGRFLEEKGITLPIDVMQLNLEYMQGLASRAIYMPQAEQTVRRLAEQYPLYLVTNGTTWVQKGRLEKMSCAECFSHVFISDELGVQKPAIEFFEQVMAYVGDQNPEHYLVIGDSASSDIAGGINAGMDTCQVGVKAGASSRADYHVEWFYEVEQLLLTKAGA